MPNPLKFLFLILFSFTLINIFSARASAEEGALEERKALEKQLTTLEAEIVEHETTIKNLKTQGKTLQSEIDRLNAKVSKLNLQIKAITIQIKQLDQEIVEKESEIKVTVNKIDFNKDALALALRQVYESSQHSVIEMMLVSPTLSDFFGDINNLISVQDSLTLTIDRITELKNDLVNKKEILSLKRSDAAALKVYHDSQKAEIQSTKGEKSGLLTLTKGKEVKFQELLKLTKKTAAQIRSRIFQLLGGGELTFEQAYQYAKLAEGATGVRAALILAVLDRESALGQNVGKCGYKTAMHPSRDLPVFLALVGELNISPESVTVSCPNSDGAYGGAMGPAQFIPSTWNIYKDQIMGITGNNPPSPWRHADAFAGTAIYLKDAGAANASLNNERIAAAKYYAGRRWRTYLWTYGERVVSRAEQFQQDIDILNS